MAVTHVEEERERPSGPLRPLGAHLVGSVPLSSANDVFTTLAGSLGERLRRIPDGETGSRSDWIVWQYPVLSARPEFEVGPPTPGFYRALPSLKIRDGADPSAIGFGELGYASAARASYRRFALLKRDGLIRHGCRFQVSLPTPIAPISAFVAPEHRAAIEPAYEAAMLRELAEICEDIPREQLAIQWDTNIEFGLLEGAFPSWFADVKGGILERLIRISRAVPSDVELGFHLCYGDTQQGFHRELSDLGRLVDISNALSASLGRSLNWLHMPAARERIDREFYAPLASLRLRPETELYLGVLHPEDGEEQAQRRIELAAEHIEGFGVATECGWGRRPRASVREIIDLHVRTSAPIVEGPSSRVPFSWPAGFSRVPEDDWVTQPVDPFGASYDRVDDHGWYKNLDPTVEQLAASLRDGDILVDYSGGTGILLDRLRLRIFDRPVGMLVVDSSPKFLRVAVERLGRDDRVGFRLLRYLAEQRRLQRLDEVLDEPLRKRGVDVIASTNAIHLYGDLGDTLRSWGTSLRPGGLVLVNSGNIRNPKAKAGEWILDETVYVVTEVAMGLVRTDPRYAAYRDHLDDAERMRKHLAFRDRVFLAPRPLDLYTSEFERAGFRVDSVTQATITAVVDEWYELLRTYHEPVLGWIGGSVKVDGAAPSEQAIADRLALIRHALDVIFGSRPTFRCCWTYIAASWPG